MAWAYAHEIAHTFGLPDLYDFETNTPVIAPSLMGDRNSFEMLEALNTILRLASNADTTTLDAVDPLLAFLKAAQEAGVLRATAEGYGFAPGTEPRLLSSGWTVIGNVGETVDGLAISEGPVTRTAAYRMLSVPDSAQTLSFDLLIRMARAADVPGDAFEVALLNRFDAPLSLVAGLTATGAVLTLRFHRMSARAAPGAAFSG
jgi:hypothetical protein